MKLPFAVTALSQFTLADVTLWVATYKPTQIEMTDHQYHWYTHLCRANRRDVDGIPIVFLDAPGNAIP